MTLLKKWELGQKAAPSYAIVAADGSPYTCHDCKTSHNTLVKTWTPDGVNHKPVCANCIDADWLASATRMEFSI